MISIFLLDEIAFWVCAGRGFFLYGGYGIKATSRDFCVRPEFVVVLPLLPGMFE